MLKEFEWEGYYILFEEGDEEILWNGKVDYLGFSYYMFIMVKSDVEVDNMGDIVNGGLLNGVVNFYIKLSDWGWLIDLMGLCYMLNCFYDCY